MAAPSSSPAIRRRFEAADDVLAAAAELAMRLRPPPGAPAAIEKGAQDWVTEADRAVEALVSERIATLFPADGFAGEEAGSARQGALRWVIDPIDGTSNYARGRARWCVSLGLLDGNEPVAGWIVAPVLGERFAALRGAGASLDGRPIRVSDVSDPNRAMIEIGWSPRTGNERFLGVAGRAMAAGAMPRSGGSGALALADIACGRLDGYVEISINLWDVAGALPILAEAGAVVSPFLRDGGLHRAIPIVAATPGLADAMGAIAGIATG